MLFFLNKAQRQQILDKFRSKAIKDTVLVFAGNISGQGLGFIATLIVVRHLGPVKFGLFSTAIAVMGLASQFSDLGISTGFVRYASLYLKEDNNKANILLKVTLYLKLIIGVSVLIFGLLISKPLAIHFFNTPELTPMLQLAFTGSLGATLWGYLQAILQAKESFLKYAWINVFNNCVKIFGIIILILYNRLDSLTAMCILALVPFVGFFIDGLIIPKRFIRTNLNQPDTKDVFYKLFHFSKWITLATFCTMFISRIDIFLLQSLSTSDQVGIYNSATQLAMIFPIITSSITTSLLPKFSNISDINTLRIIVLNNTKLIPYLLSLLVFMLLVSGPLIEILFGLKYINSIIIFRILIIGFVMGVFVNQISLIAFTLNKVKFLTFVIFLELLINIGLDYILIPKFGATGAAISNLTIKVFGNTLICLYIFRLLNIGVKCFRKL